MRALLPITAALLLASCARGPTRVPADVEAPPAEPAASRHGAQAPLVVSWEERELSAGAARLTARIERRSELPVPLSVEVVLPEGARLSEGEPRFSIPARTPVGTDLLPYSVEFESVPAGDLLLVVDARDDSFGVHAEAAYRFGRPAPEGPRPARSGPARQIGNVKLGQPVPGDATRPQVAPDAPGTGGSGASTLPR